LYETNSKNHVSIFYMQLKGKIINLIKFCYKFIIKYNFIFIKYSWSQSVFLKLHIEFIYIIINEMIDNIIKQML